MSPTTTLPLFPLPLVLFPGELRALHVFEPRYRALLADCRAGDGRFGILLTAGGPERDLPRGHVGCVAELQDVEMLLDGRANVTVRGGARFALERFVDADRPYHVGAVLPWDDAPEGDDAVELAALDADVRALFARVRDSARTIADERGAAAALPADPVTLGFAVAAAVDFGVEVRQRLLASRSATGRLRELALLLRRAAPLVEARADVHVRARSNGHGLHHP